MDIKKSVVVFSIVLFSFATMYFYIDNNITGFVVYEENDKVWDFSNAEDYSFDENINFSNNEVKINADISTASWITENLIQNDIIQATYDNKDKLDKIQTKNDDWLKVKKNKIFDISFDNSLETDSIVELYLKGGKETDICLCNESLMCDSPGDGLIHFNKIEGYYNITVGNLEASKDKFNIKLNEEVEFDYIISYNIEIEEHSETNITYVNNSVIETDDFEPSEVYSFGLFTADEELNGQSIEYSYSVDSGENFEVIESGDNLNLTNVSKIRFKASLNSDISDTAILNNITLSYTTEVTTTTTTIPENTTTTTTLPINETTTTIPVIGGSSGSGSSRGSGLVMDTRATEKESSEETTQIETVSEPQESETEVSQEKLKESVKVKQEPKQENQVSGGFTKLVEKGDLITLPLILFGIVTFFIARNIKLHKKNGKKHK